MRWPWSKRETRADSSYTDALVNILTANASGEVTAFPTATGALEAAAGFVGRAFAAAEVSAPDTVLPALDPSCLALIGRSLIRRGEFVAAIDVAGGRVSLLPAASHDIEGSADPASWTYRLTLGGPERTVTLTAQPAAGVVHIVYARDPERPWRGYGPLQVAQLAGRLSAETVAALADESSGPRGSFLPLPVDGSHPTLTAFQGTIKRAKGDIVTVQGGDWGNPASGGDARYQSMRFGASPPSPLVSLMECASREVLMSCGISPALFGASDGTASREAYRQCLHTLIAPLGNMVSAELSRKLEAAVTLDWQELRAGDIAGRARAFQSMVKAGMDLTKAAALAGLLVEDAA